MWTATGNRTGASGLRMSIPSAPTTSSSDAAETDETETTAAGETETAETESAEAQEQAKEDAKAAAKIKAEQILDDWKNGDATEDSFAELAKTYSDDTGSNTNGGLYEAVKKGQMVTNFNDWIFDASRKPGDTGIVESDYGYHIIYFVGDNKEEWYVNIKDTITSNKLNDYMSDLTADIPWLLLNSLLLSVLSKHLARIHSIYRCLSLKSPVLALPV